VPAEECIEIDHRLALREAGRIEFLTGKPELLRLGEFDDIDLAMLTHTGHGPAPHVDLNITTNGSLIKRVTFEGVAAHAGDSPWQGVNALKAATLALSAIDAQRDTFRDTDSVRISHIITSGGAAVSAVPASTGVEIMVRAATVEAMRDAGRKVDRALRAGAMALGARVRIGTYGGYLPYRTDEAFADLAYSSCARLLGEPAVNRAVTPLGASTDAGDLSAVMPVLHPMAAIGADAPTHGDAYYTADHEAAAVQPAKFMAMTVIDLLADGAVGAEQVLATSRRTRGSAAYLADKRSSITTELYP
jgi:metal-dependent amidase/aminoacylase/carboxypeptidase family protein